MRIEIRKHIKLVIFDWAGTLIDHGSVAPVEAIVSTFAARQIRVSAEQVRSIMGLHKREHIETLLRIPDVLRGFRAAYERDPNPNDIDGLFADYVPAQLAAIEEHDALIDGALSSLVYLRACGVSVATSTGYFRRAAQRVQRAGLRQGFIPDWAVCADDVPLGLPTPYMNQACMHAFGIANPREVLVVGDTQLDVLAARMAGCRSVAIAGTGNEIGMTSEAWAALSLPEQNRLLANAHRTLRDAEADFVIDTLDELPLVVQRIAERNLSSAA